MRTHAPLSLSLVLILAPAAAPPVTAGTIQVRAGRTLRLSPGRSRPREVAGPKRSPSPFLPLLTLRRPAPSGSSMLHLEALHFRAWSRRRDQRRMSGVLSGILATHAARARRGAGRTRPTTASRVRESMAHLRALERSLAPGRSPPENQVVRCRTGDLRIGGEVVDEGWADRSVPFASHTAGAPLEITTTRGSAELFLWGIGWLHLEAGTRVVGWQEDESLRLRLRKGAAVYQRSDKTFAPHQEPLARELRIEVCREGSPGLALLSGRDVEEARARVARLGSRTVVVTGALGALPVALLEAGCPEAPPQPRASQP